MHSSAIVLSLFALLVVHTQAAGTQHTEAAAEHNSNNNNHLCQNYGPQAPRDISKHEGINKVAFPNAFRRRKMNLCNIHFHINAEHKSQYYNTAAEVTEVHGHESFGYVCPKPKPAYTHPGKGPTEVCHGMKLGDTIEVHWVYSSCDVGPGPTLGSCLSDACSNPTLRVEAVVFTLVNNKRDALNFLNYDVADEKIKGFHQTRRSLPRKGRPVTYIGSTTGTSFSQQDCSPFQVTWSVRPDCFALDFASLGKWCEHNKFEEEEAHGSRKLVKAKELLSKIKA